MQSILYVCSFSFRDKLRGYSAFKQESKTDNGKADVGFGQFIARQLHNIALERILTEKQTIPKAMLFFFFLVSNNNGTYA